MYTFDWKPEEIDVPVVDVSGAYVLDENKKLQTKKAPALFSGYVRVAIPKHSERMNYLKSLSLSIKDGELTKSEAIDQAEMMIEFAKSKIVEVRLSRIEDGFVFDKVEMLEYDSDGPSILTQVASKLANGVKLGKS